MKLTQRAADETTQDREVVTGDLSANRLLTFNKCLDMQFPGSPLLLSFWVGI